MIQSQSAILVVSISAHPILCWGAVCYAGCIESAETDMADELNVNEYMAYLSGLTSGAIRGIINNGEQMRENDDRIPVVDDGTLRSEEHTSELQSLMRISYAVFCLKKKKYETYQY